MPVPRFSFIIPVRNGKKTLPGTLHSIFSQSSADFEVIVVDNGSTDGTKHLARDFPNANFLHCRRTGRSQARNSGARVARGEYLAFVDADVVLAADWLEEVKQFLCEVPLDAMATRIVPVAEESGPLDRYRAIFGYWKSKGTFLSVRNGRGAFPLINTAACIVSRSSFNRVGGFDESLRRHEDLDLSLRLFAQGYLLGGICSAKSKVRFHEDHQAGAFAREWDYLRRAFEVHSLSLAGGVPPLNRSLLCEIWKRSRCPRTLAYALLVEAAKKTGDLQKKRQKRPQFRWKITSGRNLLCTTFSHKGRSYLLKPGINFLFIDSSVYLCRGPGKSRRLSAPAAEALRNLCGGRPIKRPQVLARLNVFKLAPLGVDG